MKRMTIVILIDALGFELATDLGFEPAGSTATARLRTVLGFSQAALTSIVTGLAPNEHGLWMMYSFAGRRSPFGWLRSFPRSISTERRWLRRLISWKLGVLDRVTAYYSLYDIPRDVLPYLDLPAKRNVFGGESVPGCMTVFDELIRRALPFSVWDYRIPEEEAFAELERAIVRGEDAFCLLYTAQLDSLIHRFGSRDRRVIEKLRRYADRIGRIMTLAEERDLRVFVLGDHGMYDVEHQVDMISEVDRIGVSFPDEFVPFYDSTMARFAVYTERARRKLGALLTALPYGRLIGEGELDELGVYFPDGAYGDLVFLTEPGTILLPSFMGREPVAAMHGYHPGEPGMDSILFTTESLPERELSICDVAPLLLPGFGAREVHLP